MEHGLNTDREIHGESEISLDPVNTFRCHRFVMTPVRKKFPPFRLSAFPHSRADAGAFSSVGLRCARPRPTIQISEDAHSASLPALRASLLPCQPSPLTGSPSGLTHRAAARTPPPSSLTRRSSAFTCRPSLPTPRPSVLTPRSSLPTGCSTAPTRRPSAVTRRPSAPKSGHFALPKPFSPLPHRI